MKQFVAFAVLLLATLAQSAPTDENACSTERADTCTRDAMAFRNSNRPVPATIPEVQEVCEIVKNGSRCIRKYVKDCAPPQTKELAKLYISRFSKMFNKHCTGEGPSNVLKHRQCAIDSRAAMRICFKQSIKDLYQVKLADKKNWQALSCCFASRTIECSGSAIRKNCNAASTKFMEEEGLAMATEAQETFCPENLVWGRKECAELAVNLPEATVPANPSLLNLALEILGEVSLPEDHE